MSLKSFIVFARQSATKRTNDYSIISLSLLKKEKQSDIWRLFFERDL